MDCIKAKSLKDKNIYICMLACFLIGTAAFAYYMILDGGVLTVRDDFNSQQIPFLTALNQYLKSGSGPWCWNADLGTQMIGAYSFYNMGSPFVWLTFLFPKTWIPYLTGWLYVLKYMVAGVTSYLYLRMFVNNKKYAVVGSILYSFSGFQSTNLLFFHFHDAVALFPLLLIGLEKLVRDRKKALFIFAVFINCLTNYFFFISEVLFLIVYYIIRFWGKDRASFFKDALTCVFCGIIGVGGAAVLFIPSILYIMGNSRTGGSVEFHTPFYYAGYIMHSAKGFLLPGESMTRQSCVVSPHWSSTDCYLPMTGGALAFSYMLRKRNDWLTKLLLVLWIFSCSPVMDSAFYLFTEPYKRWWFMFVLMLTTATAMVLDDRKKYPIKAGIIINIVLLLLFAVSLIYLDHASWVNSTFLFRNNVFFLNCGISLLGLLMTWFWCLNRRTSESAVIKGLLLCISVFCAATTFYALTLYREDTENGKEFLKRYHLGCQLKNLDDQYRYNLSDNVLTLTGEASGVGMFSSTVSNSINEFDLLFDFDRLNFSLTPDAVPGLKQLLAAKYQLTGELPSGKDPVETLWTGDMKYYIVEDEVCPIGFIQNSYITKEELKKLPVDRRGIAMLANLVIDSEDERIVKSYLSHESELNYAESYEELSALTVRNRENGVTDFVRGRSGFECSAAVLSKSAVFFSIPYDDGWSAYVNGDKADILNCGGLMGLLLSSGEHKISFQYQIPGLKAGVIISLISAIVFILILRGEEKKKTRGEGF